MLITMFCCLEIAMLTWDVLRALAFQYPHPHLDCGCGGPTQSTLYDDPDSRKVEGRLKN
jgi:hypothetical protein